MFERRSGPFESAYDSCRGWPAGLAIVTCCTLLSMFQVLPAHAEKLVELHFDNAYTTGSCTDAVYGARQLHEGAESHACRCDGTAQSAVVPPNVIVYNSQTGDKVLNFATYPATRTEYFGTQRTETTLAELAYGGYYYVGFAMSIPWWSQARFSDWFVHMQFWACSPLEPFAAFRLKRGTSHTIQLIARNDETPGGEDGDVVIYETTLVPGNWHTFVVRLNINPTGLSTLKLWQEGSEVAWYQGSIGYDTRACTNGSPPNPVGTYRTKFGIYKSTEQTYQEVYFDDMRVATTFQEAKPW